MFYEDSTIWSPLSTVRPEWPHPDNLSVNDFELYFPAGEDSIRQLGRESIYFGTHQLPFTRQGFLKFYEFPELQTIPSLKHISILAGDSYRSIRVDSALNQGCVGRTEVVVDLVDPIYEITDSAKLGINLMHPSAAISADYAPRFTEQVTPQVFRLGERIQLDLPKAVGGNQHLTYSLEPPANWESRLSKTGWAFNRSDEVSTSSQVEGLGKSYFYEWRGSLIGSVNELLPPGIFRWVVTDADGDMAMVEIPVTITASEIDLDGAIEDQTWDARTQHIKLDLPQARGGSGEPYTYQISPKLPEGVWLGIYAGNPWLQVRNSQRYLAISGVARQPLPEIEYTYTATDRDGNWVSTEFKVTIVDQDLPLFSPVVNEPGSTASSLPTSSSQPVVSLPPTSSNYQLATTTTPPTIYPHLVAAQEAIDRGPVSSGQPRPVLTSIPTATTSVQATPPTTLPSTSQLSISASPTSIETSTPPNAHSGSSVVISSSSTTLPTSTPLGIPVSISTIANVTSIHPNTTVDVYGSSSLRKPTSTPVEDHSRDNLGEASVEMYPTIYSTINTGTETTPGESRSDGEMAEGFLDSSASVHHDDIVRLVDLGVSRGCNPPENTQFCPNRSVTRGELASFLVRIWDVPPTAYDIFTDDRSSVHQANINALANWGVARGCNPPENDRFCPDNLVSRGELGSFLVRGLGLTSPMVDVFSDDEESVHERSINALAVADIARGCNPPVNDRFCPNDPLSRAQLASFLVRVITFQS